MPTSVVDAIGKLVVSTPLVGARGALDPGWATDSALQHDLDDVLGANPSLQEHKFAVVDLTDDPAETPGFDLLRPAYAGSNKHDMQVWIGSLAKLLALYGAFNLRTELNTLSGAVGASASNLATAAAGLRRDYRRLPLKAATSALPKIERIFDSAGSAGAFNFTRRTISDKDLDAFDEGPIDTNFVQLPAREHLRLMVGWSDDQSASTVIRALSFEYLWALTNDAGFFRRHWEPLTDTDLPSNTAGLFLGQDFAGFVWPDRPPEAPPVSNQAGTARSVAMLLTLLAQDRLVADHAGNVGMREMMRMDSDFTALTDRGEDGPIGVGLASAPSPRSGVPVWSATQLEWDEDTAPVPPPTDPTKDLAVSKIGLAVAHGRKVISNGIIVRTTRPTLAGGSVTITVVLVGIDNTTTNDASLRLFGREMATKLDKRHGVIHVV